MSPQQAAPRRGLPRPAIIFILIVSFLFPGAFMTAQSANATNIQRVISPGGIEAWLVEQHNVPMIALRAGFKRGAAHDPDGKDGLAHLMASTMDEGAGDLDSQAFQRRLEELTMSLSFSAGRDSYIASMKTLTSNRDQAFEMLRLAMTEARFDAEPVERIRQQIIAGLKREEQDADTMAYRQWFRSAFAGHVYGRNRKGSAEGLNAVTSDDLKCFAGQLMGRNLLRISVVGDIDAKTLGALLDRTFGKLPEKSSLGKIPDTHISSEPTFDRIEKDIPQSVIVFGVDSIRRDDPDFIPAYVMNYILGGGGFASRLTEEVREKRGLTYSIYTFMMPMKHAGVFMGSASTKTSTVQEAIDIIRSEISRMAEKGVSETELTDAKTYLTGSYPLRFDSNTKIAGELIGIQLEKLGMEYVTKRNRMIEAVSRDDILRVAARILKPAALRITLVGKNN